MPSQPFGFKAFATEVKKRKNRRSRKNVLYLALLSIGFGIYIFGASDRSKVDSHISETKNTYQTTSNYRNSLFIAQNQINWADADSLALVSSLAQTFLPETTVLQGANLKTLDANSGTLRIFLRQPSTEENSGLEKKCQGNNTSHFWLQFAEYDTGKPISTAFIRANEMLELYLPVGQYRLRYAAGNSEDWTGEEQLFGSQHIYEVVENKLPRQVEKYDIRNNYRTDIGVFCINPSSTSNPISKESIQLNPNI